jgi:hypothetical protein
LFYSQHHHGATHNFFPENYNGTAPNSEGPKISVLCANNSTMTSTATDELALTKLPPAARERYRLPKESIATPLMSVRKLDKANLRTTFENDQVTVTNKKGAVILHGLADPHTNLYMVNNQYPYLVLLVHNLALSILHTQLLMLTTSRRFQH